MNIILGAGIIGLFLGHELLKKGKKVKIFDTSSIKAKSTDASVGMLAPLIEAKPQEKEIFNLMNESKGLWEKLQKNKKFDLVIFENRLFLTVNKFNKYYKW